MMLCSDIKNNQRNDLRILLVQLEEVEEQLEALMQLRQELKRKIAARR